MRSFVELVFVGGIFLWLQKVALGQQNCFRRSSPSNSHERRFGDCRPRQFLSDRCLHAGSYQRGRMELHARRLATLCTPWSKMPGSNGITLLLRFDGIPKSARPFAVSEPQVLLLRAGLRGSTHKGVLLRLTVGQAVAGNHHTSPSAWLARRSQRQGARG